MSRSDIAHRVSALYDRRSLQGYARWKLRTDPAYRAAFENLREENRPLVDLGCGVGLLAFYLREQGVTVPIIGIDFDQRKIDAARRAARRYRDVEFIAADARDPLPEGHTYVLLDILHYFDASSQKQILGNVARAVPPGGIVVIRQALRDGSWRYRLTEIVDASARMFRWMKAEDLVYPTREEVEVALAGFESDVRPLWGRTPFNTHLMIFRRPAAHHRTG